MVLDEKVIANHMKVLGLSREEATQLYLDDMEIDGMKMSEVDNDLSAEQKKAKKSMTKTGTKKKTIYKFDTSSRKKKENPVKAEIMSAMANGLKELGIEVEFANVEREMSFIYNDVKYKVVMSVPRK